MIRNGYSFGGWYDTKEHADAHAANPTVTTGQFAFGNELTEKTTVYASWIPNTTAPYTVIMWTQNQGRTGYEVVASYVGNGRVGQNIPYTTVENKDEDYVTGVGNGNGHYTGFGLTDASKNQQVVITPEGDAVLNLYYDRIEYNFKFYLYRDGTQNNSYDYANNSGNGSDLNGLVTWHSNQTQHPSVSGYATQSETVGGRTYYYFVMSAYYGENISSKWPTYDKITGANGREAVSYVMMVGTKLKPNPTNQGSGTVKGLITELNENILGATNDANGNYVVIRFPGSYYNWRYHIWFETVEGEDYTGKTLHTHNGKTYYQETILTVRSSNTTDANQNEPKYPGFDYITRMGQNNSGTTWQGGHWTTTEGGTTLYHLNYIYDRQQFPISYFDGNYVDGSGNTIQNRAEHLLHESEDDIPQGAPIPEDYKNYIPEAPEPGYVFDGWYADEGCTTPYVWDTMTIDGIKVYAKWRQEQYRVFLHPNAGTDPALDWGDDSVETSFRVSYGGKVSTPTGTREGSGYEFVGWYTDPDFSASSLFNQDTVLNNDTVTTPYDQTDDTELDKWGNTEQEGFNKDHDENRFWITRKLDLYARWRKILEGAEGINVVYTPDDGQGNVGTNEPTDSSSYPDQSQATAQAACTAPVNSDGLQLVFKHWVLQQWDETQEDYIDTETILVPGDPFTVDERLAHKEEDTENPGSYKYTIQLRAEYAEPESGLPTHIWWFKNDSDADRHDSFHQDVPIQINEAVSIQSAPTRDGYEFLGWARVPVSTSESRPGEGDAPPTGKVLENLGESDLYLKYDDGTFTLNDSSAKSVSKVAADEKEPYHDMYAVWKKKSYTVKVVKVVDPTPTTQTSFSFADPGFDPAISGSGYTGTFTLTDGGVKEYEEVPFKTTFKVTETENDEYDVSVKYTVQGADNPHDNVTDVVSSNGAKYTVRGNITVTVTNTRKTVPLKIDKVVENGTSDDQARDFAFTWKAEDGSTTVADGNFTLKDSDDPATINVPSGTKLTVTETTGQDWPYDTVSAMDSVSGTNRFEIPEVTAAMNDKTITFTNTRKVGDVKVSKKVSGNMGQTDKDFSFTASLKNGQTTLKLIKTGGVIKVDQNSGSDTITFTLQHSQDIEFKDLPAGAVLTVTETQYSDYEQTYAVGSGSSQQGREAEVTVSNGEVTNVVFTNKKTAVAPTQLHSGTRPMAVLVAISFGALLLLAAHHFIDRLRNRDTM